MFVKDRAGDLALLLVDFFHLIEQLLLGVALVSHTPVFESGEFKGS